MKHTCFLCLVNYIVRDIVTASLLMNVFRSCFKGNEVSKLAEDPDQVCFVGVNLVMRSISKILH